MSENRAELKREIGVFGLSTNIINTVVGAGIFVLPAIVAEGLGSASILAYLFCGVLVALVMLCFAEVGSRVSDAGGAYVYIEKSFGKYFGFLTAVVFIVSTISADAAVINAVSDIIGSFYQPFQDRGVKIIFFFALFFILGYINIIGVKQGIGLVKIITVAKLIPLVLIILVSTRVIEISNLAWDSVPSLPQIGSVALVLFFAFQGAESGLSVSGEVKNPQRNIPRAIFFSILGILILYILIQTISQGVLGPSLAKFKNNPLGQVAKKSFGPAGFVLITIGAAISMTGNLVSEVLSMPRVLFSSARDKVLPFEHLGLVHRKHFTPYVAIAVYAGLGFIFASAGGFKQLAIISSSSILLIYLGVALSVIKIRIAGNDMPKGQSFKIPGGYVVPILAVISIIWFLSNLSGKELFVMLLLLLFLSLLYGAIHLTRKQLFKV